MWVLYGNNCFGNSVLKYFGFIRIGLKISKLAQDEVSTCLLLIWIFISVLQLQTFPGWEQCFGSYSRAVLCVLKNKP